MLCILLCPAAFLASNLGALVKMRDYTMYHLLKSSEGAFRHASNFEDEAETLWGQRET